MVFFIYSEITREVSKYYSRIAVSLAEKRNEEHSVIMLWVCGKISFAIVRPILTCVCESWSIYNIIINNIYKGN